MKRTIRSESSLGKESVQSAPKQFITHDVSRHSSENQRRKSAMGKAKGTESPSGQSRSEAEGELRRSNVRGGPR